MKSLEELVTALESGDYAKSNGQFQTTEADVQKDIAECAAFDFDPSNVAPPGYCCLGVYATINNMNFSRDQAIFGWPTDDQLFVSKARLPESHWLIEKIHLPESGFFSAGYDVQLQSYLTDLNDDSETFEPVVRALKAFAAGQRAFPPACQFVDETAAESTERMA